MMMMSCNPAPGKIALVSLTLQHIELKVNFARVEYVVDCCGRVGFVFFPLAGALLAIALPAAVWCCIIIVAITDQAQASGVPYP